MMRHEILKRFYNNCRRFSVCGSLRTNLCGRDFVDPLKLTAGDYKQILWSALDIKTKMSENQSLNILDSKHVSLMLVKPSSRTQVSYTKACSLLGAKHTQYIDLDFEMQPDCTDSGRVLSRLTDLIVINGLSQNNLIKLAHGSIPPVIGACTNMYAIHKALADIMTILEKYKYLKELTFAWIGPSTSLCNTYLCILPLFGVNIRFCCMCSQGSGHMTPIRIEEALNAGRNTSSELHQCESNDNALKCAHVIATSMHPENVHQITLKALEEEAEFHWSFIHSLPRTSVEVSDDVYLHKNNITWLSTENWLYIAMAFLACTVSQYQPTIPEPDFEALKC